MESNACRSPKSDRADVFDLPPKRMGQGTRRNGAESITYCNLGNLRFSEDFINERKQKSDCLRTRGPSNSRVRGNQAKANPERTSTFGRSRKPTLARRRCGGPLGNGHSQAEHVIS